MLDFLVGATVSEGLLVQARLLQSLADRKRLTKSFLSRAEKSHASQMEIHAAWS
jgi:hypothetical protein